MLYIVEAQYESDRHGNRYWGPILKPKGKGYAVFTDKVKADALVAKLEGNDNLGWDVGIMGNDFPVGYRVVKQKA